MQSFLLQSITLPLWAILVFLGLFLLEALLGLQLILVLFRKTFPPRPRSRWERPLHRPGWKDFPPDPPFMP